jgi:hypothetical protein
MVCIILNRDRLSAFLYLGSSKTHSQNIYLLRGDDQSSRILRALSTDPGVRSVESITSYWYCNTLASLGIEGKPRVGI